MDIRDEDVNEDDEGINHVKNLGSYFENYTDS